MANPEDLFPYLSSEDVAALMKYEGPQTLYNQRNRGELPGSLGFKVGRRLFFDPDEIRRYIESHKAHRKPAVAAVTGPTPGNYDDGGEVIEFEAARRLTPRELAERHEQHWAKIRERQAACDHPKGHLVRMGGIDLYTCDECGASLGDTVPDSVEVRDLDAELAAGYAELRAEREAELEDGGGE